MGEDRSPETVVFETGPNGRIYERMTNGKEAHWAHVTAWEPPTRVVLAWQVNPDTPGPTEIEMRFTPEGDGTRYDFEHRGWDVLGAEAEESAGNYANGWVHVLGPIRAGVLGRAGPGDRALSTPLAGTAARRRS